LIAGLRPPVELASVLAEPDGLQLADPAFGLDLANELVVRGVPAPQSADAHLRWATDRRHPLAALPTTTFELEAGLHKFMPQFGSVPGSSSTATADARPQAPAPLGQLLAGLGNEIAVNRALAVAAVEDMEQHSNGRIVVHAYELGDRFDPNLPPPALRADRSAEILTAARAAETLFSMAMTGGAYSTGTGASHARLCLWMSLAGLLALPWPTDVETIASSAEKARWILVEPDDDWFYEVAWDLWLIAATDRTVTVLAVTDTD
jgi:hypothetical protein